MRPGGAARSGSAMDAAAADLDDDGAMDVVAGFFGDNGIAWYGSDCVTSPPTRASFNPVPAPTPRPTERCQEVAFTAREVQADFGNNEPRCVFATDLDADGDVDLKPQSRSHVPHRLD